MLPILKPRNRRKNRKAPGLALSPILSFSWWSLRLPAVAATAVLVMMSGHGFAQEPAAPPKPDPLGILVRTLGKIEAPAVQINILKGMNASLKGKRGIPAPEGWEALYAKLKDSPDADVRQQAQALAAIFGGGAVLGEMRTTLADPKATPEARKAALDSLVSAKDAAAAPVLLDLLKSPHPLRAPAIRGLAGFDAPEIVPALVAGYPSFDSAEKRDVLNTLLVRPASARALLAAIDARTIDRAAITATLARTLQSMKAPEIDAWLTKNWGAVRASTGGQQAQIGKLKQFLTAELIGKADAPHGRALFAQTCGVCHTMFGTGGKIGPELPGSFEDIDYLLQNIVDPNAIIGKDYQQTFVKLKDGQTVSGIVSGDDPSTVTLKTLGDTLTLQRSDIVEMTVSEQSMMPEGLLTVMDEESVRDLFLYLRQRQQVPLLASALNANDFFNGTDLTRWLSSHDGWKVESGELVGQGNAKAPVALVSELLAGDFRLTAQIKVTGPTAAAELVLHGAPQGGKFAGTSLSLGGPAPATLYDYAAQPPKPLPLLTPATFADWTPVVIAVTAGKLSIAIAGGPATELPTPATRTQPALYIHGAGAELRVKGLKLEVP